MATDDVAFFLLSGGTTGTPKLIPRTHDDYAYQLRATALALGVDERSTYLAALPAAHNAALGCPGVLGTLRAGGKVVLVANPSPELVFPAIEREGVTLTTAMPPIVRMWTEAANVLRARMEGVVLQVGGAMLSPELAAAIRPALGARLTHWFGMAEGLLTYTRLSDPDDVVFATQGRPLAAADVLRVVDERGDEVPAGSEGELVTQGPYTLRGYFVDGGVNATAFMADGSLRTGDLVHITPDGNLVVTGRAKDVVNRGGEKVSAGELEEWIRRHPDVVSAAVIARPDAALGERTCACVVMRPGATPTTLDALRQFLSDGGVAAFKLPDVLEVLTARPMSGVGKVDKRALATLIEVA